MSDSPKPLAGLISVDPSNADALSDRFIIGRTEVGPVHHPGFTATRAAMAAMHATAAQLADAEQTIKQAGLNDAQTVDRLRRAASAKMGAARKAAADGLSALQAHVDAVNSGIDERLGLPTARLDVNENARSGEVRAYLRSLPVGERTSAIRRALSVEGDAAVAAAVLSASPMASGLTAKEVGFVRADAERTFTPDAVQLRSGLHQLAGLLTAASAAMDKRFGPMTGTGNSATAKAAAALAGLEGAA